jgi:hypothetical protein
VFTFPLLLVPFAIYNMIAFIVPMEWGFTFYTFPLKSGAAWAPTLGDAFLIFSLLMLMFEFIKANNYGKSLVEHFLSILLAGGAAAEFVMVDKAATSTFALLVVICFVDMFAGLAASLRRARRVQVVEPVAPPPMASPVRAEAPPVTPPMRLDPVHVEPAPFPAAATPVVKVDPATKTEP